MMYYRESVTDTIIAVRKINMTGDDVYQKWYISSLVLM